MKFNDFLYTLRKEKNLTQSELAEKLGVTNKAVSKWETGESYPETAQLVPLADALGVSVDELLRGERKSEEPPPPPPTATEEKEEEDDEGEISVDVTIGDDKRHADKLSGSICSLIMIAATAAFFLGGVLANLWHPMWVVFPVGGVCCAIVYDVFACVRKAKQGKKITGRLSGIVMETAVIVFLVLGACCNLWGRAWIVFPVGGLCCAIVSLFGNLLQKD